MVKVLFFAQIQEEVGAKELDFDAAGKTVQEVKNIYLEKYDIADLLAEAMVAVNEEYAKDDTILQAGDTLAFIPPVSGG